MKFRKGNPYHDKKGKFTTKPGASQSESSAANRPINSAAMEDYLGDVSTWSHYYEVGGLSRAKLAERAALDAGRDVARVVGLGNLPTPGTSGPEIVITEASAQPDYGFLVWGTDEDGLEYRPLRVEINTSANARPRPKYEDFWTTAVHEYGHILDRLMVYKNSRDAGLTRSAYNSVYNKEMVALATAISESRSYRTTAKAIVVLLSEEWRHKRVRRFSDTIVGERDVEFFSTRDVAETFARYSLLMSELFARAFTQYVAKKLKNESVLQNIYKRGVLNRGDGSEDVFYEMPGDLRVNMCFHWQADEFAPIEKALDDLFRSKGMIS